MNNKKIIIVLLILIILVSVIGLILARYRSGATSSETIDIAYYVLGTGYQTQTLKLDSMIPREKEYNYNISISNEKDGTVTQTAIEYVIQIKVTTNLPLKYSLCAENDETINLLENTEITQDKDGVYYIKFTSKLNELGLKKEKHNYNLAIEFPIEYKANSEYADIIELIEITVDSKQKI